MGNDAGVIMNMLAHLRLLTVASNGVRNVLCFLNVMRWVGGRRNECSGGGGGDDGGGDGGGDV